MFEKQGYSFVNAQKYTFCCDISLAIIMVQFSVRAEVELQRN